MAQTTRRLSARCWAGRHAAKPDGCVTADCSCACHQPEPPEPEPAPTEEAA